ncbi:MAG: polysaccharide biosynthesis tyrosine autokinase [Paludibacteraceae bacterium]
MRPILMTMVQQFNDAIIKRNEITERNPSYPKLQREIEVLKNSINEILKNMKTTLAMDKADLNKQLGTIKQQVTALPQKEMEMVTLERKYRVDDNYYTFFLQKRAEAAIQKASNSPDNSVLDKARVLGMTNGGVKSKTYMTFGVIGLLIPFLIVLLTELLNNTIRNIKDVEKNSPFTLVGAVRHTQSSDPILAAHRPRSSFTEMFRVIRTRIEFIVQRKSKISILTTSAESGDGKTYFCTNLASVYALSGQKTILVDMDIRKPSVSDRLGLTEKDGVTNYLIGEKSLEELILKKDNINFDILLAGTVPPNPGELIRSDKLKDMFKTLQSIYDYVIVDTSPIGLVADAYSLAPLMDANIFVVRSEKTNKTFFKKLNAQLKADNVRNLYLVINDINSKKSNYYGRYSNYGYSYGYGNNQSKKKKEYDKNTHYYEDDENI